MLVATRSCQQTLTRLVVGQRYFLAWSSVPMSRSLLSCATGPGRREGHCRSLSPLPLLCPSLPVWEAVHCHGEQLSEGSLLSSPQNREVHLRPGFLSCTEQCFRECQGGCGGEGDVWFGAGLRKVVEMHQGNDLCHNPSLVLLGHRNKAAQGTWKSSLQQQKSPRSLFPRWCSVI